MPHGPGDKIRSGGNNRLNAHGQCESWVKINWRNLPGKMREQDNILHRRPQVNLIRGTLRLNCAASQEARGEKGK